MSNDPALSTTRRAWHGVAELVLAGPQWRHSHEIRLGVRPGGVGTVAAPDLAIVGAELVAGPTRLRLADTTPAALAEAVGVDVGVPDGVYPGGSGVRPDDPVAADPAAAAYLAECFARGEAALRRLAPAETPVLWPEHFDLAIAVDEVNYGVSPGDDWLDEPYAYVGPWQARTGSFWTAPFGAATPLRELSDVEALLSYLIEGRERAHHDPLAS